MNFLISFLTCLILCLLQYYCCKRNDLDGDTSSGSQPQFACNACSAPGLDGGTISPLSLFPDPTPAPNPGPTRNYCPTCSPYGSPFYVRSAEETRNGGERVTYMPTHYDSPSLSLPLPSMRGTSLSSRRPADVFVFSNTRAISTEAFTLLSKQSAAAVGRAQR
ncbi:hypothetical protein GJAV_G00075820 [Gymnothorax javanicus]|nr:hypothetical protein GJAV_G00075820 [Gymnothorax javanicus]